MENLEKSIIVVAHPDDENLWFSSILSKVDWIVICFLAVESRQEWTEGRRKSLSEYPLKNVSCLGLNESEVFWGADWTHPIRTEYGLKITENHLTDRFYKQNFDILKDQLRETLSGYRTVFTHNPWGEYGHVEHVQVYCALKALQKEMGFALWFTNYVSNKSIYLMAMEYPRIGPHLTFGKTDNSLAESIADLYKRHNCWTWYNDYEWCDKETFIKDIGTVDEKGRCGDVLPINFVDVGVERSPVQKSSLQKFNLRIRRIINKFR